jgi:hypothetical protein
MIDRRTPKRPRWLRFSLRTFVLAITGLCIWLGVLAARAHRQHAAVNAIRAAGGTVVFDYENEGSMLPGPAWLRQLIGDDFFCSPTNATLVGENITDDLIEKHLSALSQLQILRIGSTKLTDKSLAHVAKLSALLELELNCPQITVAGLEQLAPLKFLVLVRSFRNHPDAPNWDVFDSTFVTVDVDEVPVSAVLQQLTDKYHVPILLDAAPKPPLSEPGISLKIKNATLQLALGLIAKQCNFQSVINLKVGAIVIAAPEAAPEMWPAWAEFRNLFPHAWSNTDW